MKDEISSLSLLIEKALHNIAAGKYQDINLEGHSLEDTFKGFAHQMEAAALNRLKGVVDISVQCGESMISIASVTKDVRDIDHRAQSISAAVEEMVASVNEIARASEAAAMDADQVSNTAENGMHAAESAISAMNEITDSVNTATERVNSLAQASEQIGEIVAKIEAVASQTNLLALNATIEAARAGEAGKGFAVVASEVKNLSTQTAKATDDIRMRIDNLRGEMEGIIVSMQKGTKSVQNGRDVILSTGEEMKTVVSQVQNVNEKMQDISHILSQQQEASSEISQSITDIAGLARHNSNEVTHISDTLDKTGKTIIGQIDRVASRDIRFKVIELAKSDHILFKKRIMDAIIGRSELNSSEVPDCHHCRLGKWYYEVKEPEILNNAYFKDMEDPHDRVHTHGKQALDRFNEGDFEACMAEVGKMSVASEEVLTLLDQLGTDMHQKTGLLD